MGTSGSQRAVQHLVDEHYVALYRYAFRLTGSAVDAEDLTQDTFLKAQANLAQLRAADRAKPWLFRILRNAYLHRVRADRHEAHVALDGLAELAEPLPEALPDVDPEKLQAALNELP